MTDKEFNARANCLVIGWLLGVAMCLGLVKIIQNQETPATALESYYSLLDEELERHRVEQLRHSIALYGEQK